MENRTFIPGSEWIYFKIYTGSKTADTILKNEVKNFIVDKDDKGDKWFFIRYSDPDFHIRLRLHLKDTRDFSTIFNRFYEIFLPLVDAGLVWKIQCDTYQREIERYGANTINIVEDFFFIDSVFMIELLNRIIDDQHRWKLALALIDSFLSVFSFELTQRKELLNTIAVNFKKEFGFTHHDAKKQLDNKFRTYRKDIETAMLWENTIDVIKDRKQAIFPVAEKLIAMEKTNELQVPLNLLLTSMIHMTMNRLFRTKNRLHELVIYDFLSRYYTSELAKNNKTKKI